MDNSNEHVSTSQTLASDNQTNSETTRPRVLKGAKLRRQEPVERSRLADLFDAVRRIHPLNRLAISLIVIVVVVGGWLLVQHALLSREFADARILSDQVVASIAKRDTVAIRALGEKKFQTSFDKTDLSHQLDQFAAIYANVTPVIDGRLVDNTRSRQYVAVVYRYNLLKVPFYIRIDMNKPTGSKKWYVQAISSSHDSTSKDGTGNSNDTGGSTNTGGDTQTQTTTLGPAI